MEIKICNKPTKMIMNTMLMARTNNLFPYEFWRLAKLGPLSSVPLRVKIMKFCDERRWVI